MPVKKNVSFDLKQMQNIPHSRTSYKPIIFNGTFPIDCPITNKANNSYLTQDYVDDEFYYQEDDGEENDESYSDSETLVTQNFLVKRRISVNYKEMCSDVENSFTNFEKFLNDRRKSIYLRTFEIDAPIEIKKSV